MKKFYSLLLFFCFCSVPVWIKAGHNAGAEITYVHLGAKKYLIQLAMYRDCRSLGMPSTHDYGYYTGKNGMSNCGKGKGTMTRVSIQDVTTLCSGATSKCSPPNTASTGEGMEKHLYVDTVDLNKSPFNSYILNTNCCEISFFAAHCCRIGSITTGGGGENIVVSCTINFCNLNKCSNTDNTSAIFNTPPPYMLCCNERFIYNHGVTDSTDKDLLKYHIRPALKDTLNKSITYTTPYSYKYPFTPNCKPPGSVNCTPIPNAEPPQGFYTDTATGAIIFVPTKCDEVGPIAMEIQEWRKDTSGNFILISKITRDINFIVRDDCGYNKSPRIENNTIQSVVAGDKLSFEIKTTDSLFSPYQTTYDTITAKWYSNISNAIIKVKDPTKREKTITFEWQTKTGDARDFPYTFTLNINDLHCPRPSVSSRMFRIFVKKLSSATFTVEKSACNTLLLTAKPHAEIKGPIEYSWKISNAANGSIVYTSPGIKSNVPVLKKGKYYLQLSIWNEQYHVNPVLDSVTFGDPPNVDLGANKKTCYGNSVTLTPTITNSVGPWMYSWTSKITFDPPAAKPSYTINQLLGDSLIQLIVTDSNGCEMADQIKIFKLDLPNPKWSDSILPVRCYDDRVFLVDPFFNNGNNKNIVIWDADTSIQDLGAGTFRFNGNKVNNVLLQNGGIYKDIVYGKFTDSNGCFSFDKTEIRIIGTPMITTKNLSYCQDFEILTLVKNITLPAAPSDYWQKWTLTTWPAFADTTGMIYNNSTFPFQDYKMRIGNQNAVNFGGTYNVEVELKNKNTGCAKTNNFTITVVNEPVLQLQSKPEICQGIAIPLLPYWKHDGVAATSGFFRISAFNGNPNHPNVWGTKLTNGNILPAKAPFGNWQITYTAHNFGCNISDSFILKTRPVPVSYFTLDPDSLAPDPPYSFTTKNQSSIGDNSQMTYEWDAGTGKGGDNSTAIEYTIIYPSNKSPYKIRLIATSNNNCKDTFERWVMVGTASTYDLAAAGLFFDKDLVLRGGNFSKISTEWYDLSGKLIAIDKINSGVSFSPGVYIFKAICIMQNGKTSVFTGRLPGI